MKSRENYPITMNIRIEHYAKLYKWAKCRYSSISSVVRDMIDKLPEAEDVHLSEEEERTLERLFPRSGTNRRIGAPSPPAATPSRPSLFGDTVAEASMGRPRKQQLEADLIDKQNAIAYYEANMPDDPALPGLRVRYEMLCEEATAIGVEIPQKPPPPTPEQIARARASAKKGGYIR